MNAACTVKPDLLRVRSGLELTWKLPSSSSCRVALSTSLWYSAEVSPLTTYRGGPRLILAPGFRMGRSRIRMYLKDPLSRWTSWMGLAALEVGDSWWSDESSAVVSAGGDVGDEVGGSIIQESIMRLAWASKPGSEKSSLPGAHAPAQQIIDKLATGTVPIFSITTVDAKCLRYMSWGSTIRIIP